LAASLSLKDLCCQSRTKSASIKVACLAPRITILLDSNGLTLNSVSYLSSPLHECFQMITSCGRVFGVAALANLAFRWEARPWKPLLHGLLLHVLLLEFRFLRLVVEPERLRISLLLRRALPARGPAPLLPQLSLRPEQAPARERQPPAALQLRRRPPARQMPALGLRLTRRLLHSRRQIRRLPRRASHQTCSATTS